jgi:hypothetical protein
MASFGVGKVLIMGGFGLQEILDDDDDNGGDKDDMDEQIEETVVNIGDIMIQDNSLEIDTNNDNERNSKIDNHIDIDIDKDNKKVSFAKDIKDNNDIINDNNIEEEIELTYLSDCFLIDLLSLTSSEIDLEEMLEINSKNSKKNQNNSITLARRGTKAIVTNNNMIKLFGGFNGESFSDEFPKIDSKKLENTSIFFPELSEI